MRNQKRRWTVEAERGKSAEPILKAVYPWNPRAAAIIVERDNIPAFRRASAEYRALLRTKLPTR
jgi:hypothetical protein